MILSPLRPLLQFTNRLVIVISVLHCFSSTYAYLIRCCGSLLIVSGPFASAQSVAIACNQSVVNSLIPFPYRLIARCLIPQPPDPMACAFVPGCTRAVFRVNTLIILLKYIIFEGRWSALDSSLSRHTQCSRVRAVSGQVCHYIPACILRKIYLFPWRMMFAW